jgi:murein L,D-transpeptidase YcbB/YkuD
MAPNRIRSVPVLLAVLSWLAITVAGAQEVDELIRARVEQLAETGRLEASGAALAARTLLPKIYEARAFRPAWQREAQVAALLEVIEEAEREGLDPTDYHVEEVAAARERLRAAAALAPAERAEIDLMLTDAVIRLGYHLRFGKVDPVALDPNWNLSRQLVDQDPVETIQAAIDAPSMLDYANQVIPRNFLYHRLKHALAEYRAIEAAGGWPRVPEGPTLRVGMRDARVTALKARLAVTGDYEPDGGDASSTFAADDAEWLYDEWLASAVRRFQERHGLAADGVVGRATLAALNVSVRERIEQIRANLERARWVTGDLAEEFLVVNIAGFRLYHLRNDEVTMRMRVQVGRPYRRTPVFKAKLTYLVANPTWTVPPTIFREDLLPELRRDPTALVARNIDVLDSAGNVVDPRAVNWHARSLPYRLVQRPGPNNALGRLKFMFPNEHSVYLHDTPSRDLFERESRAFSSGCIRVEDPIGLALKLLGPSWDRERLDRLIASGKTQTVFLEKPIDVLLLYWTTEVDAAGRVYFWPDIYGRDPAVIAGLARPFAPGAGES